MRRAVVLVGGPAAPYARAIRVARALAVEGFAVEIAAVASSGLPEREAVASAAAGAAGDPVPDPSSIGPIEVRRYRPTGPWTFLGASAATSAAVPQEGGSDAPRPSRARALAGVLVRPAVVLRRWLLWPHTVRGWWATLARDLAPADLYHAFGTLTIAPALAARDRSLHGPTGRRAVVIYDAIDDALESNAALGVPRLLLRRRRRIETGWARAADATITVNDELAERLGRRWHTRKRPLVVPNVPEPPASPVEPVDLRSAAGLPDTVRVVLFQGRLGPGLGLEAAADAVLQVPDAALVLLGFGRGVAAAQARDRDPRYRGRHVTLAARHPDELLAWTAGADVAIIPLPPVSANQRASTPNKFWEALASGTPVVVVSGLTAMERLVREHDLGAVAASASSDDLAAAIRVVLDRLDAEGPAWRTRIAALAAERFAWPPVATAYRSLVRGLVQSGAQAGEPGG